MNNIFDTHAHYTDKAFDIDRKDLLCLLFGSGICGIINCGTDIPSSKASLKLSEEYDGVFAACGIHPEEDAYLCDEALFELKKLISHEKCVAIGEIGLDYHYRTDNKELQKEFFEKQILLANESSLPVIIHDREAHGDTMEILKRTKPTGVLHCFSGSAETMREAVKLGMYIGLGGAITFKNAQKPLEVLKDVPLERLLFETDCPYMAPVPFRGKRNNSALIEYVAQKAAEVRGLTKEELLLITKENAERLFSVKVN